MIRARVALTVVAMVIAGSSSTAPLQQVEGTVTAFAPGESLTVVNDQTDPSGLVLLLRNPVDHEADLRPGARVKLSFRVLGERGIVADRVRLLPN